MKKILLLTFALLLAGGTVFAQEGAKVGFRASPLISWAQVTSDSTKLELPGVESGAKLGFSFDFVFSYGFSENIGLMTGINIATRGFKQEFSSINTTFATSFTAIEIPIGLKFRSPEIGDGFYIVGNFGVRPELNVQNKVITTVGSLETKAVDVDGINFLTGSFTPAVGVNKEFDWGMLEGTVTYHWGILDYYSDKGALYDDLRARMNAISLNIGYYF